MIQAIITYKSNDRFNSFRALYMFDWYIVVKIIVSKHIECTLVKSHKKRSNIMSLYVNNDEIVDQGSYPVQWGMEDM